MLLAVFEVLMIYFYLATTLADPGYLPVNSKEIPLPFDYISNVATINVRGVTVYLKYCRTCNTLRLPRTVHCSICDRCVCRFDHHCPWFSNCIGIRNYRSFMFFLLSTLACFMIITPMAAVTLYTFYKERQMSPNLDVKKMIWPLIVIGLMFLAFFWFILGLACYHTYLISLNRTTYEHIKHHYHNKINPWNESWFNNIKLFLISSSPPDFNNDQYHITYSAMSTEICLKDEDYFQNEQTINQILYDSSNGLNEMIRNERKKAFLSRTIANITDSQYACVLPD